MFRHIATLASIVAVAGLLGGSSSQAANQLAPLTKINKLTFSRAVSLPGVTLTAGTYVFESGPVGTDPNIVRVLSPNRQTQFYLGFTIPRVRPYNASPSVLTFGEARAGEAARILIWYPGGSTTGHEFMYR
jgi:hypothetical protein